MAQPLHQDVQYRLDDTKIGFSRLNDPKMWKAYYLFRMMKLPALVKSGGHLIVLLLKWRFPIKSLVRHTMFEHFCGGETISEAACTAQSLAQKKVGTVFDYAVEGIDDMAKFEKNAMKIRKAIEFAAQNPELIPFCVFKVTGLARFAVLEKLSAKLPLTPIEQIEWEESQTLMQELFQFSAEHHVKLMVDAEESWITPAIDVLVEEAMAHFNKDQAIIYHTLQMYRHDRLAYFHQLHSKARKEGFHLGVKLVRGAYLEKENLRAAQMGYPTPMHASKEATDFDFDAAVKFGMENLDRISLFIGTHNEASTKHAMESLANLNLPRNHPQVFFSQLYGMSDVLTFNLAYQGYNTCKYVPYGPIGETIPYLMRRAEENASVLGQTSRELQFIIKEMRRRELLD